jgi:hypothetical protein
MTRTIIKVRWILYGAWVLAAVVALMMALTPGLELLGLPPERVTFLPGMITGLPWTLPLFLFNFDSVTSLAIIFVAHLLSVSIGLMLVRSVD